MKRFICFSLLPVFLGLTVSCARVRGKLGLQPEKHAPVAADVAGSFPATEAAVPMPERWWKAFGSDELDGLMTAAFADNLSVSTAWLRLRQAQAQARIEESAGKIQLGASGDAGTSKTYEKNGGNEAANSFGAGLSVSYEVDLWGRISAASEAALLNRRATREDVQATALLVSGQVASAWVQCRATMEQLALVKGQIKTSRESLDLLKVRQRKGMSALVDVLQQQQQVASLESGLPALEEELEAARLQLAYLLGRSSDAELKLAAAGLPSLPPVPQAGLPAELLEKRPDIRAALLRLQAQEWVVVSAKAERLPSLSLTGAVSSSSADIDTLFDNWVVNLAAGLTAPLIDGGRRKAEVKRNQALADEYFLAYRDTVLSACHEVAEALMAERWRQVALQRTTAEVDYADQTLKETRRRYLKGIGDYLPVLSALSSKQTNDRSLVSARESLLLNRIGLYTALGGDWIKKDTSKK